MESARDGRQRLYVLEQPGRIRIINDGVLEDEPLLDIRDRVAWGGEMGLLGIAFHPRFNENRRFFLDYTVKKNGRIKTIIAEYKVSPENRDVALRDGRVILEITQPPHTNHKGGQLAFGPDGFLYIGVGDGGGAGDPHNNAQNANSLLGKILRINVDHGWPYSTPPDNPFGYGSGKAEIWAWGLRNPWRFSFDRKTGRLFCADVGQNNYEEIDLIEGGKNYGWNIMEGFHCYPPKKTDCPEAGLALPIFEYDHSIGICIIGGNVYHGKAIPGLEDAYIFGDYGTKKIWTLRPSGTGWVQRELARSPEPISSFGEDEDGEIYVAGYWGTVYQLVPGEEKPSTDRPAGSP